MHTSLSLPPPLFPLPPSLFLLLSPLTHYAQLLALLETLKSLTMVCTKMSAADGKLPPVALFLTFMLMLAPSQLMSKWRAQLQPKILPHDPAPYYSVCPPVYTRYCNLNLQVCFLVPHRTKANMTFSGDFDMIVQAGGLEEFKR